MTKSILTSTVLALLGANSNSAIAAPSTSKPSGKAPKKDMKLEKTKELYRSRQFADVIAQLEPSFPFGETDGDLEQLKMLGQSYYGERKFDLAIRTFRRYIEIQEKLYPDRAPHTSDISAKAEANEEWRRKFIERDGRIFEPSYDVMDLDRYIVAMLCAEHGQISVSEELFQPDLANLNRDSKVYRDTKGKLADLYVLAKEYQKAATVFKSLLQDAETKRGKLSPEAVSLRTRLAAALVSDNQFPEAETLYRELLHVYESPKHSADDLANALSHQAHFYFTSNHSDQAEAPLLRALAIRKREQDDRNLVGKTQGNLQTLYERLGDPSKITTLFEETSGKAAPVETPEVWKKKAVIYARAGNLTACEQELQKLIQSAQGKKGESPFAFELINAQYSLGQIYLLDNKLPEATAMFEDVYSAISPTPIVTLAMVGSGDIAKARRSNEDIFGVSRMHEWIPNSCHYLAAVYAKQNRFEDAAKVYSNAIEKERKANARSYILVGYFNALAWIYLQQRKYELASSTLDAATKIDDIDSSQKVPLMGNKTHVIEQQGGDASVEVKAALNKMKSKGFFYFEDPVQDFALPSYERQGGASFVSGGYKSTKGEIREEPLFGWSIPALVEYSGGQLGAKDNALYPNEFYRGELFDPDAPHPLEFLHWSFESRCLGERSIALAEARLGDIYQSQGNFDESEKAYDRAIKDAESEIAGKDALAAVYERKASLYRKTNRNDEANRLDSLAKELHQTPRRRFILH